ncbi:MAG: DNA mismatch repair protein MutS, partial [Clostridia bacterium]|nr:DNA mismatch repair protein MutS [Clostridia bacterium]
MMQQYLQIKEQHPGCLLFFRLGDFYEMFFDDAKIASRELELVLTGKDCGMEERAPMCGVPFHSCESYIARLVSRGYKVAICEQTEDPVLAKGLVKRDVVRVITPGTVIEGSMLDEGRNNYLCAAYMENAQDVGVCFADCSTGEIHVTSLRGDDVPARLVSELGRFSPSEILLNTTLAQNEPVMEFASGRLSVTPQVQEDASFDADGCERRVLTHFGRSSLSDLSLTDAVSAVRALGCLIDYLTQTQMTGLERISRLDVYTDAQYMKLDLSTRRNLELLETMRSKEKRGSLLGVLDHTRTAMGKRLLRMWLEQPLLQPVQIDRRLNAVEELTRDTLLRGDITELLSGVYDLERIMTRIVYGSANAKELRSLSQTIRAVAPIKARLSDVRSAALSDVRDDIDPLTDVAEKIEQAIVDDPPLGVREGGMIREGYNAEIDELRFEMNDGKGVITRVETTEKERTGIAKLKVGYNRVFGYYIEIPRSYTGDIPEEYIRKQTTTTAERYITQELKTLESRVLGARDRVMTLEYQLFTELRTAIAGELHRIQKTAQAVARLDVFGSFADTAVRRRYVRPTVDAGGCIEIKNGRHPVVEELQSAPFVPNDALLDRGDNRVLMITGPNMAGKSTYMRQIALLVLMAQVGSFVPAQSAHIGVVDRVFTRIGASDDLSAGKSTFMVEMTEVAEIMKNA